MTTICAECIQTTDYLHAATDLRIVIAGNKAGPFRDAEWFLKVRGLDENGDEVGVAYYELTYSTKAEAMAKARLMLAHVKALRSQKP